MEYTAGAAAETITGEVPEKAGFAFVFPCGVEPGSFVYSAGGGGAAREPGTAALFTFI